jgi:uncharacterized repeat protein (TIGR01451 family)
MKKVLAIAAMMLLGSSGAWALTKADTTITNSASLTYSAGGVDQTNGGANPVNSNPDSFIVDKKVDFTLTNDDGGQVTNGVVPGASDRVTTWTLTNTGNMDQNFTLASDNLTSNEEIYSDQDTAGKDTATQEIWYKQNGGSWTQYNAGDKIEIKGDHSSNALADRQIDIEVRSDIPTNVANGNILNIKLTATAVKAANTDPEVNTDDGSGHDRKSVMDTVLAEFDASTGNSGDENNANTDKNAITIRFGGYKVTTANLTLSKNSCVYSDLITNNGNKSADAKRIPGATIIYTLDIHNDGSADATDVNLTDNLQSDLDGSTLASGTAGTDDKITLHENQVSCDVCSNGDETTGGSDHDDDDGNANDQSIAVNNLTIQAGKHTCIYFRIGVK